MTMRVLIADDHTLFRAGLRALFASEGDIEVVGEAANGEEAVAAELRLSPDVVLMDLLMPVMDGVAATEAIRRELPDTEVVALTSVLEEGLVVQAIQAGAIGYLLKDTDASKLCKAIKSAAAGQVELSPAAAALLMHRVKSPRSPETLTERETEVLRHLARGESNKEIASSLFISETTVKTHVKNIMQKLGVPSRTHAALFAARVGLVSLAVAG